MNKGRQCDGSDAPQKFRHVMPPSRLGTSHSSLDSYQKAVAPFHPEKSKHYTLIVVTEPHRQRILLGLKLRGFGKGMYNSFGGKVEEGEDLDECAARELEEETGISVERQHMSKCHVGLLRFTFEDSDTEMVVHLYRIQVSTSKNDNDDDSILYVDSNVIRPCDEIVPQWWDNWYDIPLDNMFADDSLWLTRLLESPNGEKNLWIEGHFHFEPGGQEVNTNRHYFLRFKRTLEQQLFHQLHVNRIHNPSIKEFKESFALAKMLQSFFQKDDIQVVVDVAGGHGALAALLLILLPTVEEAVVLDPANVGKGSVQRAWGSFYEKKTSTCRHECLRTGLPKELERLKQKNVLVVACHACQHLSEEILKISCGFGVSVAVMPCCQKDASPGSSWKAASKNLGIPVEKVMDILLAGKVMGLSWQSKRNAYDVRMKLIDEAITPQNRVVMCRHLKNSNRSTDEAHEKLKRIYKKAHENNGRNLDWVGEQIICGKSLAIGLFVGLVLSLTLVKRR
jgi:8-oxo-dGTP pyrophosphatase MutT (NUDIX family)